MEQGPVEEKIIIAAYKAKRPLPDRIQNAPNLSPELEIYYRAFWELSTCRSVGFALGPIPWLAIRKYAEVGEFDSDMTQELHYYIRAMDERYLRWASDRSKHGDKR